MMGTSAATLGLHATQELMESGEPRLERAQPALMKAACWLRLSSAMGRRWIS